MRIVYYGWTQVLEDGDIDFAISWCHSGRVIIIKSMKVLRARVHLLFGWGAEHTDDFERHMSLYQFRWLQDGAALKEFGITDYTGYNNAWRVAIHPLVYRGHGATKKKPHTSSNAAASHET